MTKHILYSRKMKFIGLTMFIVTISLTVNGFIAYQKILQSNDQVMQELSILHNRIDSRLREQYRNFDLRLKNNRSSVDSIVVKLLKLENAKLSDKDQNKLLEKFQAQNKMISNIVSNNQYLDNEIKRLKHLINENPLNFSPGNLTGVFNQNIPINDIMRNEDQLTKQATVQMLAKIDIEFEQLSQDTHQSKLVNTQISDAIYRYNDTFNKQLQLETIDCRESMCKIKINYLNYEDMDYLEQEFIVGISDTTDAYTLTQNINTNPNGSFSSLYYLSME